jgi:hypothetical protein
VFILDKDFRDSASKLTIDSRGRAIGQADTGEISEGEGSAKRG